MTKTVPKEKIRNIAIIAHVDHGKTTLVDAFLKQSKIFRQNQHEMQENQIMDSNELERERGITILAKNTAIPYKDFKINIVDTPGHSDFSGEVERTLNLAEGCLLIVDAQEGVMPQTRFVLKKAMELGLKPIVVINKIDKKLADPQQTNSKIQDLFLNLATDPSQLDFRTFYAVGRLGKVFTTLPSETGAELEALTGDITPLLDEIVTTIPAPSGDETGPFQMQVTSVDFDQYYGRYLIGKVSRGIVCLNDTVSVVGNDNSTQKHTGKIKRLCIKNGLEYEEVEEAAVGEIIAIAGIEDVTIGNTLCDQSALEPLPEIDISPPSLKIKFEANTSPFLGKEGKFCNLKQLQQRLDHEAQINIGLKIERNPDGSYYVSGRGELHIGVLIETLRREGYEFQVRRPEVIIREVDGVEMEPLEELYVDVPEEYYSAVSQEVSGRKGELVSVGHIQDHILMTYTIRTRNLIGLFRLLMAATKGNVVINTYYLKDVPVSEVDSGRKNGCLVSSAAGIVLAYALNSIQERGELFITPSTEVYEGMIIGINKYENNIAVNPMKSRERSNVRMSHAVVTLVNLKSPILLTLEYALGFLDKDEILEVTPKNLRLRKQFLTKAQEYETTRRLKKAEN